MSNSLKKFIICGIFLYIVGFCWGSMRWVSYYMSHVAGEKLSQHSPKAMERVVRTMVQKQPFTLAVSEVMRAFPVELPWMHTIAHWIGEEAYRKYGFRSIGMCGTFFNHGCYHGVVQLVARIHGPDIRYMDRLYTACVDETHNPGGCSDPLGHASTILSGYDIQKALRACDTFFAEVYEAQYCGLGAFMEYFGHRASSLFFPGITEDALVHMCDIYPIQHQPRCVEHSLTYMVENLHYTMVEIVEYCHAFGDEKVAEQCFYAAGALAAELSFVDGSDPVPYCAGLENFYDLCMIGILRSYQSVHQYWRVGPLCPLLHTGDAKNICETILSGKADVL